MKRFFAALAASVMIGWAGGPLAARAQTGTPILVLSDENTITVQGTGEVQAAPDIARLTLGVQTQNADAARASQDNATKSAALIKIVKSLSIADKDIQTSYYDISPLYDQTPRKPGEVRPPQIVGYQITNTILVTVRKIADVGKILDAGVKAGANTAGDLSFDLNDETKARLQTEALTQAVGNARSKADTLAKAANVGTVSFYSISETGYAVARPRFAQSAMGGHAVAEPKPQSKRANFPFRRA